MPCKTQVKTFPLDQWLLDQLTEITERAVDTLLFEFCRGQTWLVVTLTKRLLDSFDKAGWRYVGIERSQMTYEHAGRRVSIKVSRHSQYPMAGQQMQVRFREERAEYIMNIPFPAGIDRA